MLIVKSASKVIKQKKPSNITVQWFFVIQAGFEPATHALEGRCSIQLSYQTNPCLKF